MIYKLAPHVTEEMLVQEGFEIKMSRSVSNHWQSAIRENDYIPLEDCEYGNRVIQNVAWGTDPEDLNPEHIQDLIAKGMVVCE